MKYVRGKGMIETAVIGERGQITIPINIRNQLGLRPKDKVIVDIENHKIVVEKARSKKELEKLMIEGYKNMARFDKETEEEMKYVSTEADEMLDDY